MSGVELDPAELHAAGTRLGAAAQDASPGLTAATAGDCGTGFPGTAGPAYDALMATWAGDDTALLDSVTALSTRLHQVAHDYVATDQDNAHSLPSTGGPDPARPTDVLNM